jgi:hypothetical protein
MGLALPSLSERDEQCCAGRADSMLLYATASTTEVISASNWMRVTTFGELGRTGYEAIAAYVKTESRNSLTITEENHKIRSTVRAVGAPTKLQTT